MLFTIIFVSLVEVYKHQRRKKRAICRCPAETKIKGYRLPPFLQQKPELDGDDSIHEVSAEEMWIELHADGRWELQRREMQMELHEEGRQELQVQGGETNMRLHEAGWLELQGEEVGIELYGEDRQK